MMIDEKSELNATNLPAITGTPILDAPLPNPPSLVAGANVRRLKPNIVSEAANDNSKHPLLAPILISVNGFCHISGLGKSTAWKLIAQKKLEVCRIGRRTLITAKSVQTLIEQSIQKEGL